MLDKQSVQPPLLNAGGCPPVHPNDVRITATANEVILTFALVSAQDDSGKPAVQEVAKLVVSWPMLQVIATTSMQTLSQATGFRVEALEAELEGLRDLQELQEVAAAEAAGAKPDGHS